MLKSNSLLLLNLLLFPLARVATYNITFGLPVGSSILNYFMFHKSSLYNVSPFIPFCFIFVPPAELGFTLSLTQVSQ